MPRKRIKVVRGKYGREQAYGIADDKKRIAYIDERLTGLKELEIHIHEADHIICPEWSEEKVLAHSKELAKFLYEQGYRKTLLVLSFLFLTLFTQAQNLVPNGSFESPQIPYSEQLTISGNSIYNNVCLLVSGGADLDYWQVYAYDPARIVYGYIPSCFDNDAAQDGISYLSLKNSDNIIVDLLDTLKVGCLYQFTCYLNLQTNRGASSNPSVMMFFFYNPDGNTIQSPIIYYNLWQQFSVPFISSAPSTKLEVVNWVFDSDLSIDNISVVKLGCPLPIIFGYVRTKDNTIEWMTESEINSDRYEIISSDGMRISTIKAAGNTTQRSYYSVNVPDGYYIIKQIDIDGNYSYSDMIRVNGRNHEYVYSNVFKFYTLLGQER